MVEVSYDLQVGVLGSLLLEPRLAGQVMTRVRAEDFVSPVYRTIYQAIAGLFLEGKPVDILLVKERLSGMGQISQTLLQIMDMTPTAANVWEYVAGLKEQAALVCLREIGQRLEGALALEEARALVDQANGVFSARPGVERVSAQALVEDFMERHGEGKHPDYLTWPMAKLDDRMYTEPGDMVLLGGYPSAGKTALALRFAWHMARRRRVGFYSLETKPSKLGDRSVAAIAGIDMGAIKRSALTDGDWTKLADHAEEMAKCSLDLIPAGGMTVRDIQADALSQLSRPKTTGGGEEAAPTMSSLRESGQLEQDADAILLLYRENPDKLDSRRVLYMAKNKEGGIGKIYLDFDGQTQTFRESDTTSDVVSAMSAAGRKARKRIAEPKQMTWTELEGKWAGELPFQDRDKEPAT